MSESLQLESLYSALVLKSATSEASSFFWLAYRKRLCANSLRAFFHFILFKYNMGMMAAENKGFEG